MFYNELIENELYKLGATIVGFADLSEINEEQRKGFQYGVSIAIALNPNIVAEIPTGPHIEYYNEYESVSKKLIELSQYTERFIISNGFNAFSQSKIKQDENYTTPLPHKTVATRVGIGWIGKSATLVNEIYGNAIRLNSILTDMPFVTGAPINNSKCGNCQLCVKYCPGKAVLGVNWDIKTSRDVLLNPYACKSEVIRRGIPFGLKEGTCGICIAICKYTQCYIQNTVK
jgi:epoxyqueuosine reductase